MRKVIKFLRKNLRNFYVFYVYYNKREMSKTLNFYISQLLPKRAIIYSESWYTVGRVIYSNTQGSEEGYDIWHRFSKQDVKNYSKDLCDMKWKLFKKRNYIISLRTLIPFIYEDGGSSYNPNHKQIIVDEEVKNFVYDVLLPKLSIRRMRNVKALNNLCSALFHMSSGKDRDVLDDVCKRIKNARLRKIFVSSWEETYFKEQYGLNNIIMWLNLDEK